MKIWPVPAMPISAAVTLFRAAPVSQHRVNDYSNSFKKVVFMEYLIEPKDSFSIFGINISCSGDDNLACPGNAYQCGCNTVAGCACPSS